LPRKPTVHREERSFGLLGGKAKEIRGESLKSQQTAARSKEEKVRSEEKRVRTPGLRIHRSGFVITKTPSFGTRRRQSYGGQAKKETPKFF